MLIGIIDEDQYKILNIEEFFTTFRDIDLIVSGNDIENFIVGVTDNPEPDVIFIRIKQSGFRGTEQISNIRKKFLQSLIIVVTSDTTDHLILESFKAGASGYMLAPILASTVYDQPDLFKQKGTPIPYDIKNASFRARNKTDTRLKKILTKREIEVVHFLLKGMSYKEIANSLNISFFTVNDHVKNIYTKLNINSKGELLSLFIS
ncbi:response regulator transcription factor [Flectobacillus sp. DC10W]|uniref:Response regulator transcription factor n=1 Tax=Flectobacillus longus TaxID=2984207 RepID=A0ABT6YL83_9BACT|nr:response regulator transcription factor [Flectobacillus longus]MDI9864353.1 response regulator transcription factor [Flectobacillus longus]